MKRKTWSITSTSSLHAKMYIVDRRYVLIGSFNLDSRSAWLNTEMGVLIDSPELAGRMIAEMAPLVEKVTYRVYLRDGDLVWRDLDNQQEHDNESEAGLWRRFQAFFFRLLPIDPLL